MFNEEEFDYWSEYMQDEKKKREQKKKDDELAKEAIEFMKRSKEEATKKQISTLDPNSPFFGGNVYYEQGEVVEKSTQPPLFTFHPQTTVFQIRRQTSDNTHVLCGVYSSVQSIIDHFPYQTHSLRLSECGQYVIAEMVKEKWETYTSPKVEFFPIIESKVM